MSLDEYMGVVHHFPTDGNKVYIKQMVGKAGDVVGTHRHEFEHYSILATGSVVFERDGAREEIAGPAVITVDAHQEHKITFLTDVVWYCVHGTDEIDQSKIDEVLIGRG